MNFKKLPIYQYEEQIVKTVQDNQVTIIKSPTGSGKTTQIPLILHRHHLIKKRLGMTQPRRIAAITICDFIAGQIEEQYQHQVNYAIRFDDQSHDQTFIKVMTDGILLQEIKFNETLDAYDILMIDEVHERSLNIDFLLGLIYNIIQNKKDLKIILSSATMDTQVLSKYFHNCPVIDMDVPTYPVEIIYQPLPFDTHKKISKAAKADMTAKHIFRLIGNIKKQIQTVKKTGQGPTDESLADKPRDILVFLPGQAYIHHLMKLLASDSHFWVLPLYGRLKKEEQIRVFQPAPEGKIKIVLSTNLAETSVTIDNIYYVIDSGLANYNYYNFQTMTSSLVEQNISQASCLQRTGRAGRTQAGVCYRLYDLQSYYARPAYTPNEINRSDLTEVVLKMAHLNIVDFHQFPFLDSPPSIAIDYAIEFLKQLQALDENQKITSIGSLMNEFPVSPSIARAIVEALMNYNKSIYKLVIIASYLCIRSPFLFPFEQEVQAREAQKKFYDDKGDFMRFFFLNQSYQQAKDKLKFTQQYFLDHDLMHETQNIQKQLFQIIEDQGFIIQKQENSKDHWLCLLMGLQQFICLRIREKYHYMSLTEKSILIHPSSCLFGQQPKYILAAEVMRTRQIYAYCVGVITPEMIKKVHPQLLGSLEKLMKSDFQEAKKPSKVNLQKLQLSLVLSQWSYWKKNLVRQSFQLKHKKWNIPPLTYRQLTLLVDQGLLKAEIVSIITEKYSFDELPKQEISHVFFQKIIQSLTLGIDLSKKKQKIGFYCLQIHNRSFKEKIIPDLLEAVQNSFHSLDVFLSYIGASQLNQEQVYLVNKLYRKWDVFFK